MDGNVVMLSDGRESAAYWSPVQCLEKLIQEIESGDVVADNIIVVFREKGKRIGWRCAGHADPYEKMGMVQGFFHNYNNVIQK